MKACISIFIEPNGVNAFIQRAQLPENPAPRFTKGRKS